jgi:hypothetical protein
MHSTLHRFAAVPLLAVALLCPLHAGCQENVSKEFRPKEVKTFDYKDWQTVLEKVCTSDGFVKYDGLRKNTDGVRDALFRFVGLIGEASPVNRPELFPSANDKLAYYINAYNATCMFGLVQKNYPKNVKDSGIFLLSKFKYGGEDLTLDTLEKERIRSAGDPRVHFAVNCMSHSCPPLRQEAYTGDHLDKQLDDQGHKYLSDPRGAVLDNNKPDTVKLSEIMATFYPDEFKAAFEKKSGKQKVDLLDALRPLAGPDSPVLRATKWQSMPYDWSLNEAK